MRSMAGRRKWMHCERALGWTYEITLGTYRFFPGLNIFFFLVFSFRWFYLFTFAWLFTCFNDFYILIYFSDLKRDPDSDWLYGKSTIFIQSWCYFIQDVKWFAIKFEVSWKFVSLLTDIRQLTRWPDITLSVDINTLYKTVSDNLAMSVDSLDQTDILGRSHFQAKENNRYRLHFATILKL